MEVKVLRKELFMSKREIRCPKFCSVMFLLSGLGSFLSIGIQFFECFVLSQNPIEFLNIAKYILSGSTALFISVVLFKKRYDKLLLGAVSGCVVSGIFSAIVYGVTEHLFSLSVLVDLLILFIVLAFVCDLEKGKTFVQKIKRVIPVVFFICLFVDGIFMGINISEKINADITILMVMIAVAVFLPVVILNVAIYYKLVLWVLDPFEEKQKSKKKKVTSR